MKDYTIHHYLLCQELLDGLHAFEQRANNRIIRPSSEYTGPEPREFVAIKIENNFNYIRLGQLLANFKTCWRRPKSHKN